MVTQYAMSEPAKKASGKETPKQNSKTQSYKHSSVYPRTAFCPSGKRPGNEDGTCSLVTPPYMGEMQPKD